MNSLFVIEPYRTHGMWAFDDEERGLLREPFIGDVNLIIDHLLGSPGPDRCRLLLSAQAFPGAQAMSGRDLDCGGRWYYDPLTNHEGWLCPALLKYFDVAPDTLYVKAETICPSSADLAS